MVKQKTERYRFEYKVNKAIFDIFFFIDDEPFKLLFGAKATNFSFELSVKYGFIIDTQLDKKTYAGLCDTLGLKYDPNNPFSPKVFFEKFNDFIPQRADIANKAEPHEVGKYYSYAEEDDKIYFLKWKDNNKRGEKVQLKNLEKTKKLLGKRAYVICKEKNISSCWTDKKELAKKILLP